MTTNLIYEENFEEESYEEVRQEVLNRRDRIAGELIQDSPNVTGFAAVSDLEGQNLEALLKKKAGNEVQEEAARFIRYELTEGIRSYALRNLGEGEIETSMPEDQSTIEQLQRSFFMMDRGQRGYIDLRPVDDEEDVQPERYPGPISDHREEYDRMMPFDESDQVSSEGLGQLNLSGIYVMNDDWIIYRNGREPLGVDEEHRSDVKEYLEELGVGR